MSRNQDPYLYTGTNVLRNKLDIRDQVELDRAERILSVQALRGMGIDYAMARRIADPIIEPTGL